MQTRTAKLQNIDTNGRVRVTLSESPRIRSEDLFGTRQTTEVLIEHAGSIYRLRRTRQGKLILHK